MALITTDTLAQYCPFFGNGVEKLQKASISIDNTQRNLLPILCEDTYNELIELEETGYLTGLWQDLYDRVVPWLAWASFANYLPFSQHTDTDAGLRTFSDDNSVTTTDAQLRGMIDQADNYADSYLSEIRSFLERNDDFFTDWKASNCYSCYKASTVKMKISGSGYKRKTLTPPYTRLS